jgi:iron(III) transport system permease protein
VVAAVVAIPLVGLAWKAGRDVQRDGDRYVQSWSAAKVAFMVARSPWESRREIGWTLAIGATAAVVTTVIALAVAWAVRQRRRGAPVLAAVIALGAAVPAPLIGVWLIGLLNRPSDSPLAGLAVLYDRTLLAPIFVQTVRALPLVTLWLWRQLASVPSDLLDAARCEGAGAWRQLWFVALPLRWPSVVAALVAGLAIAVGELSATLLVLPPGVTTISVRVFQLLHYGIDDRMAGLCLAMFAAAGLATAAAAAAARAGNRHRVLQRGHG